MYSISEFIIYIKPVCIVNVIILQQFSIYFRPLSNIIKKSSNISNHMMMIFRLSLNFPLIRPPLIRNF